MNRRPEPRQPQAVLDQAPGDPVEGVEMIAQGGAFLFVRREFPLSERHGGKPLAELLGLNMKGAALLAGDRRLADYDVRDALFLDTETTGLSGGAGTLAFLIGLGFLQKDTFVVNQLFLRDFSEEKAALRYLADVAGAGRFLVSYNGKAFDANLLAGRFVVNRLDNPLLSLPHLDLLFPARRLCGRLKDARLATLEREVCRFHRPGDLPAQEIPGRYFSWLRRRDPALIGDIFRHNLLDVLSLAALTVGLAGLIGSDKDRGDHPPGDLLAAARLLSCRGELKAAGAICAGLRDCGNRAVRQESRRLLSLLLKRQGELPQAVSLWEEMIKEDPDDRFAALELAKWYEHRRGDCGAALDLVKRMLGNCALSDREEAPLKHRLRRLQGRLERKK